MTSLSTTWSPNSFQLRLALNCRKSPVILVRMRVRKLDRQARVLSVGGGSARSGNGVERRSNENSWKVSNSSADAFSGWSGDDGGEPSVVDSERKRWLGGLGAGVAGVILVAGLTFATLSLSKRNTSSELTVTRNAALDNTGGSVSLASDDQNDRVEQDEEEGQGYEERRRFFLALQNLIDAKPTNLPVFDSNSTDHNTDHQEGVPDSSGTEISNFTFDSTPSSAVCIPNEPLPFNNSVNSPLDAVLEPQVVHKENGETVDLLSEEDLDLSKAQVSSEGNNLNEDASIETTSLSPVANPFENEQDANTQNSISESSSFFESTNSGSFFSSAGIPAPSVVSAALQVLPGKVLVPAVVDQVQGQALAALQVLKVIEPEVQPGDLCTRREYARWLVSASSTLSRSTVSKVYPAMYIENVTELAFDDITPEDHDFSSIQGLAEAGLIASKLSRSNIPSVDDDQSSLCFSPGSPLSRQDLVTWKMALEKRQLPEADRKVLHQLSGFIDIDKINPDACPALVADLSAGENGIVTLAFGYTRLFQPDKPVTKAQAAIALATGEASDIVSEELARIEAESMAENAVAAHSALVAQVEKDVNASFEKELLLEREKIDVVEKLAEEAMQELERLRSQREEDNIALMKERAAIESEMEVLSRLRREVEEQLESLMSNKVEISYEKERLGKLLKEAETENQEIARLQYELEVERKALSMARAWAEDEAKRAREQAKVLEEARDRWERQGIKVVVDEDLREEANVGVTWLNAGDQFSVEGTVSRAETLVEQLKTMIIDVRGKAKDTISRIIHKLLSLISVLKEWALGAIQRGEELKDTALSKMGSSLQELHQSSAGFTSSLKDGAKRVRR
ncbi:hypothetical protein Acr_24g0015440 [Actinidia rufa]|uniref:SLH domain-containing protein n=1 Tax=Actinidia rufa TaxID=165716 RepID=A0A7J0GXQ9_9ERIC|nr:hypothetical protein Acr_24g0015440 [Actinidia rufa]